MPEFKKLTAAEIATLTARQPRTEALAEYLSYLDPIRPGDWGSIELSEGELQRAIKRRTSTAARSQGKQIKWRRSPRPGQLVFQVLLASSS